ncbi:MAG: Xaa-Pro peptidase family protein [Corynebacterium sp.]|nr:Xaa-Pro peptidase family protein [Corynebacterium sp.]
MLADSRFARRRRTLTSTFIAERLDALLVTHLPHVRYLSNFSGSNAALLLNKDHSALISTDGRYVTQIGEEVPDIELLEARQCDQALLKTLENRGPLRVGFEADYLSVAGLEALSGVCPEGVELIPISGEIEKIRLIKDEVELQRNRDVAGLANQALKSLLEEGLLAVGRTENQVAADLEYKMRILGAECPSFETIVAAGLNSAKPHHRAGNYEIAPGDLVTIDYGAHDRGFNSDCTRTYIMGHTTDFSKEIYEIVLEAQLAGVEAATPGTPLVEVDKACRDIIEKAGYGEYFVHSTGHGIGLDVHEAPYASKAGKGELAPGMTLTIEPGIYVPGKGGVRIEDTLIITDGAPEIITTLPKDLTIIG